ncbi:MAG: DUF6062 family protein, partial [Clostridiales bacterium]|nr:DUF6062 family protein [Clostridiales bacterium]
MQYHIQTTPIWDSFKERDGCPACRLLAATEARFVAQYLGEGVMEPDYRVRVNKTGFCARHLSALFAGQNKLGLALQVNTRTAHIIDKLSLLYTEKDAKKQAAALKKTLDTCVICEETEEIMIRYAQTIAQMFRYEREFPR